MNEPAPRHLVARDVRVNAREGSLWRVVEMVFLVCVRVPLLVSRQEQQQHLCHLLLVSQREPVTIERRGDFFVPEFNQ